MEPLPAVSVTTALLLLVGCVEVPEVQVPAADLPVLDAPLQSGCPLGVPGSKVAFEETPEGGALTFTAPPERVDELRERAHRAFVAGDGRRRSRRLPPARIGEEPIDGGSRVTFAAVDPRDRDALRAKLRARAEDMRSGCGHRM